MTEVTLDKGIPIPDRQGGGRGGWAAKLAREGAINDSVLVTDEMCPNAKQTAAGRVAQYGTGWYAIRREEVNGKYVGVRIWKTHEPPGKGKKVPEE